MQMPETSRMKIATDQKCRLWRGVGGGGAGGWPAGARGDATAGPVGDLRKRFSSLWLPSVDNRSSLQADPFEGRAGRKHYTHLWPRIRRRCDLSKWTAASRPL